MKKNVLVMVGLAGLLGWGIYDFIASSNETEEIKQEEKAAVVSDGQVAIGIQEGNKAPDFQLQTVNGELMKLSDLEGKKVILNFWATFCPPCKAEMPDMQKFYLEQQDHQVEIVAVNLTMGEMNPNDVEAFVNDYGLTFPVLLDLNGDIGQMYQTVTIPTSYLIDSQGIIRKKIVGPMDKEMMNELIESVE